MKNIEKVHSGSPFWLYDEGHLSAVVWKVLEFKTNTMIMELVTFLARRDKTHNYVPIGTVYERAYGSWFWHDEAWTQIEEEDIEILRLRYLDDETAW